MDDLLQRLEDAVENLWDKRAYAEHVIGNDWLRDLCRVKIKEGQADILRLLRPRSHPRMGIRDAA